MIKVVIYASNEDEFKKCQSYALSSGIAKEDIIFCDSTQRSRLDIIQSNISQWLLFIDSDCEIDSSLVHNIFDIIRRSSKDTDVVFSGFYSDPQNSRYLQRAHNFIANMWLEESYLDGKPFPYILGGIFLVFNTGKNFKIQNHSHFWGGEDKLMSYLLFKNGFQIVNTKQLQIKHVTSASVIHFLRRAWLHGANEVKYFNFLKIKKNYLFMIRKVGFLNLYLLPPVLIHFCIQRVALIFQKILQVNKK